MIASSTKSSASRLDERLGANPPSSPTPVECPFFFRMPRSVWKISAPVRSASLNDAAAERHHHEFLEVDAAVGVRAAVEDIHHRRRQHRFGGAAPPYNAARCS